MESQEYNDYLLIKHLYHCKPSDLEKEDQNTLDLHLQILLNEMKKKEKLYKK